MSIAILPIGEVDPALLEEIKASISRVFKTPVVACEAMPVPGFAFYREPGGYLASDIIDAISKDEKYSAHEKVLAVFGGDIFMLDLDFDFVFGEARDRVALVSLAHLKDGLPEGPGGRKTFMNRVFTETLHELSHIYGIGHCRHNWCVMSPFEKLPYTDSFPEPRFCDQCLAKLRKTGEALI